MQKRDLKRQTEDPARCLGRKKKEQNKLIVNEIKKKRPEEIWKCKSDNNGTKAKQKNINKKTSKLMGNKGVKKKNVNKRNK